MNLEPLDTRVVNPDPLMSMKEAAKYLGVSNSKMYELVCEHDIPVVMITKDKKIRQSSLERFISCRQISGKEPRTKFQKL